MIKNIVKNRVLTVVMDGIGLAPSNFGNAVANASRPNLNWMMNHCTWRTLLAHGKAVGLPSDIDIGNSEVGHNAIGAGRIFDQGAKLVQKAIDDGSIFVAPTWRSIISQIKQNNSPSPATLHFIGLLSDGNVHSHENHLYAMLRKAKWEGVSRVRIHVLFDGRDVGEKTAETYVHRLEDVISEIQSPKFDIAVASGGGRMSITMDRYEADWEMVERGWNAHVRGQANLHFKSLGDALKKFRETPNLTDQNLPSFVIDQNGQPAGIIKDGDAVIFFNFRGDRAIEISRAFTDETFSKFDRGPLPKVYYAGMMQYDGDLGIPKNYLVPPPAINNTLGEYLAHQKVRQFACSETQKYGHVTYFWNGNRSGYFDQALEEYVEIPSDRHISFDLKPWMKAYEITEATIKRMRENGFDFGRINFANGDMVGHTGNYEAALIAVETVDLMLGRLINAARETNTTLIVTADHGNADEMFDAKEKDFPHWEQLPLDRRPTPKTAHTINPVPFAIFDPTRSHPWTLDTKIMGGSLGNIANTALVLLGLPPRDIYLPSLIVNER